MRRAAQSSALAAVLVCATAPAAAAQAVPFGRVEVGVGLIRMGEISLGDVDAALTTPSGGTTPLFKTSTVLEGAAGFNIRAAVRVWDGVEAEMFASIIEPRLATTISADVESTASVTATERVQQYVIGGGGLWYLPTRLKSPKFMPFVSGGVAYLRQLHESRALAVTGRAFEAGAGAKYLFMSRRSGGLRGLGVRADARIVARSRGVAFDDSFRYAPAVSASLFARF